MGTREVSPRHWRGDSEEAFHALRSRWRTASLASGWLFPNDWALPEVDLVCEMALAGADLVPALRGLGRARAEAGAGLGETLQDLAALHAVLTVPDGRDGIVSADPDAIPARLLRAIALAWSDVMVRQVTHAEVGDGLTGLATVAYLRTRLRELYREGDSGGTSPDQKYGLVVVGPRLTDMSGWSRLAAMVLLADVLSTVFDGGQTLATLGPSTLAVLAERDDRLPARLSRLRNLASVRLAVDPQLRTIGEPSVWVADLPPTHAAACQLVTDLGRA